MDGTIGERGAGTPWWLGAIVVVGVTLATPLLPLYTFLQTAGALVPARLSAIGDGAGHVIGGSFDVVLVLGALFGLAGIGRRYALVHARHR